MFRCREANKRHDTATTAECSSNGGVGKNPKTAFFDMDCCSNKVRNLDTGPGGIQTSDTQCQCGKCPENTECLQERLAHRGAEHGESAQADEKGIDGRKEVNGGFAGNGQFFKVQPLKAEQEEDGSQAEGDVSPGFAKEDGDGCQDEPDEGEFCRSGGDGGVVENHIEVMKQHKADKDGIDDINRDGAGFLGQDVLVNPGPEFFERGAEEAEQDRTAEQGKHDSEVNQVLRDRAGDVRAQVSKT